MADKWKINPYTGKPDLVNTGKINIDMGNSLTIDQFDPLADKDIDAGDSGDI